MGVWIPGTPLKIQDPRGLEKSRKLPRFLGRGLQEGGSFLRQKSRKKPLFLTEKKHEFWAWSFYGRKKNLACTSSRKISLFFSKKNFLGVICLPKSSQKPNPEMGPEIEQKVVFRPFWRRYGQKKKKFAPSLHRTFCTASEFNRGL